MQLQLSSMATFHEYYHRHFIFLTLWQQAEAKKWSCSILFAIKKQTPFLCTSHLYMPIMEQMSISLNLKYFTFSFIAHRVEDRNAINIWHWKVSLEISANSFTLSPLNQQLPVNDNLLRHVYTMCTLLIAGCEHVSDWPPLQWKAIVLPWILLPSFNQSISIK